MATARLRLNINQHDTKTFIFNVTDENGSGVNPDVFQNIIFIIANTVVSPSLVTKSSIAGEINKTGEFEVSVDILGADSSSLPAGKLYCEVQGQTPGPEYQTLGAGSMQVTDTQIADKA